MLLAHLYTWALATFFITLVATAALGILAPTTTRDDNALHDPVPLMSKLTVGLFFLTIAANAFMIIFLEGFSWVLPDDPTDYHLIEQIRAG
jgi:hypothetical protein